MGEIMDHAVVKMLNEIINGTGPILSRFQKSIEVLKRANLLYELCLTCDSVMVHPSNRAGLGVNPHEVHRLGQNIYKVGFHIEELNPYAIEAAIDPQALNAQFEFNRRIINLSNNLLAPISGKERYLSVGGGHLAQFVRAVTAGCNTTFIEMADQEGLLDKHKLLKDSTLRKMCEEGFTWTIVKHVVDKKVPGFADFMQRALNSTNSIRNECTELEVMCSIAEFLSLIHI